MLQERILGGGGCLRDAASDAKVLRSCVHALLPIADTMTGVRRASGNIALHPSGKRCLASEPRLQSAPPIYTVKSLPGVGSHPGLDDTGTPW